MYRSDSRATSCRQDGGGVVAASLGLRFDVGHVLIDTAYRYHGIYADFRPQLDFVRDKVLINVNSVYLGLGLKF